MQDTFKTRTKMSRKHHTSHAKSDFNVVANDTLTRNIPIDDIMIPMLIESGSNVSIIDGQAFEILRSQMFEIKLKRLYNNPKHMTALQLS
ncbi:hypothetical protein GJ496_002071 [Pomphorhynchus laevis]|nr:hypothetical protein GJ496_002071 [Pomphorhynchus laevis]